MNAEAEDIAANLNLWNKMYFLAYHKYCYHTQEWVYADELKCIRCNKDGNGPKCFRVGGGIKWLYW